VIWDILFYIWLAGYSVILLAIAKTYTEGYLRWRDCLVFVAFGTTWPVTTALYLLVRCL
jgi:hypothetical protein